jgi:predicted transposase YbfD/YdcC
MEHLYRGAGPFACPSQIVKRILEPGVNVTQSARHLVIKLRAGWHPRQNATKVQESLGLSRPNDLEQVWTVEGNEPSSADCSAITPRRDRCPAVLEGEDISKLFLRGFLKLENGVPSHDTFSRLFRLLDPAQFGAAFQRFMARFSKSIQGVVAIDGKVLRRSFDRASGRSALHMVSAWGCEQRLVLAQIATNAKSNEITAVPKLLAMLSLKGTIVTADALNCQRAIAQQIIYQGGDYVLALKGNQGTLHDDVSRFLDDPACKATATDQSVDGYHGRIETPTAMVSTDTDWLQGDHRWPGLAAIGKVVRIRETATKTTTETAYYLLSTTLSGARFNEVASEHWGVENRLHWRLDVVMNEDQDRTPIGQRPTKPRGSAPHGSERHAKGCQQGLLPRQAQAGRLGRRLPFQTPRTVLKCDCPVSRATNTLCPQSHRSCLPAVRSAPCWPGGAPGILWLLSGAR